MSTTISLRSVIRHMHRSMNKFDVASSSMNASVGVGQGHIWKESVDIAHVVTKFRGVGRLSSCSAHVDLEEDGKPNHLGREDDRLRPMGDLFHLPTQKISKERFLSKSASIRRTFGPQDNDQALLTLGGHSLAANASFDPQYHRARKWIHHHAVGPAVLSPVLLTGLVGALVEAALPSSIVTASTMTQVRPLIVGLEVEAKLTVRSVRQNNEIMNPDVASDITKVRDDRFKRDCGYEIYLDTQVSRVRDGAIITKGSHTVWIADYGL
jgi:acyl dehydratase